MKSDWLKARQTKYAAYATLYIAIFCAVLVVANVLADRYNKSYDATANKRYSLSDQTLKILHELKNDVNITYFDRPTGFQQAKDLLDRYGTASTKVHVKYVDLYKNPTLARAAGVTKEGSAIVELGPKKEEAKSFDEQGITGALIRDEKGGARTICNAEGSGEHRLDDSDKSGLSRFKELAGRDNYQTKTVNLLQSATVPSDCTVLVVAGPTGDYVQPEVDAIKKYVEDGGRALIMLDPPLKMGRTDISENAPLTNLLQSWGVTADKDLILDLNPVGQIMGLGPQIPLVTKYESHAIVNELKGTATGFPLARSLDTKNGDKTTVEKLFGSSDSSFATKDLAAREVTIDEKNDKKGPLTMAAAVTYNTGKPNSQGRVVVVGNSGWMANSFIAFNGNRDLALNMLNWLSSDEDLISIRPKENEDRRINLTRAQMSWIRMVSQFGLPLIVIVAGAAVWWRRR
jgi:ABC-type uncharacterized transport system involved in gliding motility auxiliary subunit